MDPKPVLVDGLSIWHHVADGGIVSFHLLYMLINQTSALRRVYHRRKPLLDSNQSSAEREREIEVVRMLFDSTNSEREDESRNVC